MHWGKFGPVLDPAGPQGNPVPKRAETLCAGVLGEAYEHRQHGFYWCCVHNYETLSAQVSQGSQKHDSIGSLTNDMQQFLMRMIKCISKGTETRGWKHTPYTGACGADYAKQTRKRHSSRACPNVVTFKENNFLTNETEGRQQVAKSL